MVIRTWERTEYFEFHQWPESRPVEYTKHRDVVQFYVGRTGEEVTYKGRAALPAGPSGRLSAAPGPLH